jgi:hypothetical protein
MPNMRCTIVNANSTEQSNALSKDSSSDDDYCDYDDDDDKKWVGMPITITYIFHEVLYATPLITKEVHDYDANLCRCIPCVCKPPTRPPMLEFVCMPNICSGKYIDEQVFEYPYGRAATIINNLFKGAIDNCEPATQAPLAKPNLGTPSLKRYFQYNKQPEKKFAIQKITCWKLPPTKIAPKEKPRDNNNNLKKQKQKSARVHGLPSIRAHRVW